MPHAICFENDSVSRELYQHIKDLKIEVRKLNESCDQNYLFFSDEDFISIVLTKPIYIILGKFTYPCSEVWRIRICPAPWRNDNLNYIEI